MALERLMGYVSDISPKRGAQIGAGAATLGLAALTYYAPGVRDAALQNPLPAALDYGLVMGASAGMGAILARISRPDEPVAQEAMPAEPRVRDAALEPQPYAGSESYVRSGD